MVTGSDKMDRKEHDELDDLAFARMVRDLPRSLEPDRDLWPGIERRVAEIPQRRAFTGTAWIPAGVAASVLFATAALVIQLLNLGGAGPGLANGPLSVTEATQVGYAPVRNPLMEEFNRVNSGLDPVTLDELHRNLEILSSARRDIEEQVRLNPGNSRLVELLMHVHEQELDLLKSDFLHSLPPGSGPVTSGDAAAGRSM